MTPFDSGLQPERTELAWRRTALSVGIGSLIALRLIPAALGDPWWVVCGVVGTLAAVSIWLAARHRYRMSTQRRVVSDRLLMPSAVPLLLLAGGSAIAGVVALAIVVVALK